MSEASKEQILQVINYTESERAFILDNCRRCHICQKTKDKNEFHVKRTECKLCFAQGNKLRYQKRKNKINVIVV